MFKEVHDLKRQFRWWCFQSQWVIELNNQYLNIDHENNQDNTFWCLFGSIPDMLPAKEADKSLI